MTVEDDAGHRRIELYTPEAFSVLCDLWVRTGWALRYSYGFSWMGRPIIQLPEDMVRIQEVVYRVRPDLLIETGIAHGGSLVFYATLFKAIGHGRVVGVDIEIRPHNREALEAHELFPLITLLQGDSVDPSMVKQVRSLVNPGERVLVVLDSNHTKAHVAAEISAYAPLVSVGSYIVVADGIMADLHDVPGGRSEWRMDNPQEAAREFAAVRSDFHLEDPRPPFDETKKTRQVTYWPGAYLRRVRPAATAE